MRSPPLTVGIVVALGANAALSASVHLPPATKRGVFNSREGAVGRQAAAARLGSCRGMARRRGGEIADAASQRGIVLHMPTHAPAMRRCLRRCLPRMHPVGPGRQRRRGEGVGER